MMAPMRGCRAALVVVAVSGLVHGRAARACSGGQPPPATAIPRTGASGVSTATSIVVVLPREPFGVGVVANGQAVPVSGWRALGGGIDGGRGPTQFWQLNVGMLAAGAEYAVTLPSGGEDGGSTTLTTFSTAAGYDKTAGTPANLRGLHLWRVRYPVADIASGNCVFAEYHSFVTVDYDAATLPGTAPGSVIQVFQLAPETGGTTQAFVYTGDAPFAGLAPMGDYPIPLAPWQPDLDPTRRYCLAISAIGNGDLANLGAGSNRLCADVVQLSAAGAPTPPVVGGVGGGAGTGGSGGSAGADAGAVTADAGAPPPQRTSGGSGGGCSMSDGRAGWLGTALLVALALAAARRAGARRR